MARDSGSFDYIPRTPQSLDSQLREMFGAVERQPVPGDIAALVDQLETEAKPAAENLLISA